MKNMSRKLGALIFCAAIAAVAANAQTARPTPDSLRGLKRALETASAPALSAQHEGQLKALAQQSRESRKSQGTDSHW